MKITITGAGEVGYHLAKMLAGEAKDITIIDEDQEVLNHISSHIDVITIKGDANLVTVAEVEKLMAGDASGRVSR